MSHTLTLPDCNHADSARISDLKRSIKDLTWTGNAGSDRFHFCFAKAEDLATAKRRLRALQG